EADALALRGGVQPLAGLHDARLHELLVVVPHVPEDLLARHLAGFGFLARLHNHHHAHLRLLSLPHILVERAARRSTITVCRARHGRARYRTLLAKPQTLATPRRSQW